MLIQIAEFRFAKSVRASNFSFAMRIETKRLLCILDTHKYNISFYLLILTSLYLSSSIFNFLIGYRLPFRFWTDLSPHAFALAWSIVITLPYFIIRRRKNYFFVLLLLHLAYLLANVLYYRTYYSIIPINSIKQLNNINGLLPSIVSSFRWHDVLLLVPTLTTIFLYYAYFRRRMVNSKLYIRMVGLHMSLLPALLFLGYQATDLLQDSQQNKKKLEVFYIDPCQAVRDYGIISDILWQISEFYESDKPISPTEEAKVKNWLAKRRQHKPQVAVKNSASKNVVLILFESLETWPLEKKIGGVEITPTLNELLSAQNTLYAPKVIPQTKDGRSSDAQFIINSGLLPLNSGAVFFRYPKSYYYSLPRALKASAGYHAVTMLGDEPSFWNQGEMNPSLGFDELYSKYNFDMDEEIGMGLSDASFLKQAAEKLDNLPQPFFAQLITLSSHMPFDIPSEEVGIELPPSVPATLARYLEAINYTDRAIGAFMRQLKISGKLENTIVVIAGDHEAFSVEDRKKIIGKHKELSYISETATIPFIVVNAPVTKRHTSVMGQIDIYPTLLNLLDLNEYVWQGAGKSILAPGYAPFAITPSLDVVGDVSAAPYAEIQHKIEAWKISDIIIRRKYFEHLNRTYTALN